MENKIISQELELIDKLIELVNTQEEYEYLLADARKICPGYIVPSERQQLGLSVVSSSSLKGGAA